MNLSIREIDSSSLHNINKCDATFMVNSKLVLRAENDVISYTIVDVEPYQKKYPLTDISNPEKTIFFAYMNDQLAGQIRILKYWNAYAYIDDVAVDVHFRRQGVGRALINRVIDWAKANNFPGIMLETQNNNVAACRLYESCGFILGGFDRHLYKGLHPQTDEIAMYWYLMVDM
jgi:ribosomal protein S18 acetylase RimI-like enzyme